jgi:hypothetical protein
MKSLFSFKMGVFKFRLAPLRPCHLRAVIGIDDRKARHPCRAFLTF